MAMGNSTCRCLLVVRTTVNRPPKIRTLHDMSMYIIMSKSFPPFKKAAESPNSNLQRFPIVDRGCLKGGLKATPPPKESLREGTKGRRLQGRLEGA